ncbi:MAG: hypothetical protein ACLUFF_05040, partial [Acutalibacteraceae bacterium]
NDCVASTLQRKFREIFIKGKASQNRDAEPRVNGTMWIRFKRFKGKGAGLKTACLFCGREIADIYFLRSIGLSTGCALQTFKLSAKLRQGKLS